MLLTSLLVSVGEMMDVALNCSSYTCSSSDSERRDFSYTGVQSRSLLATSGMKTERPQKAESALDSAENRDGT